MEAFKSKIKAKPVSFWKNGEDLYGRCSIALMKAFNAYPREGWVRASEAQDKAAANEIIRLSAENSFLRARLSEFEALSDEEAALSKVIQTMRNNRRQISVWRRGAADWEPSKEVTLYQIFEALAPEMQIEFALTQMARYIATNVLSFPNKALRPTWPTPRNRIRSMLADLAALGCVSPSVRSKPVADTNEYWSLTAFGAKLLGQMRRRRLEKLESLEKIAPPPAEDKKAEE